MNATDFYGGDNPPVGTKSTAPMEVAPEAQPVGKKPAHFLLVMVALLVAARVFYELGQKKG